MPEITLAVLGEKIDNMHTDFKEVKDDVKKNTEFRLQFKGIVTAVAFLAAMLGVAISKLADKIFK